MWSMITDTVVMEEVMMPVLFRSLMMAWVFTCLLEVAVALGMRVRERRAYLLILFVNLLTNPLANLLYRWAVIMAGRMERYHSSSIVTGFVRMSGYDPAWLWIETLVLLSEGWIYGRFREWIPHPWKYALAANLCSALLGMCWQHLRN